MENITVYRENGEPIELTLKEGGQVYRQMENVYLLEDAKNHLEDELSLNPDYEGMEFEADEGFLQRMVDRFYETRNCDVAEDDTWANVVREFLPRMDGGHPEDEKEEGNPYDLTAEEAEDLYRRTKERYLFEDARTHLEEELYDNPDYENLDIEINDEMLRPLVERFRMLRNSNVPEVDTWDFVITGFLMYMKDKEVATENKEEN